MSLMIWFKRYKREKWFKDFEKRILSCDGDEKVTIEIKIITEEWFKENKNLEVSKNQLYKIRAKEKQINANIANIATMIAIVSIAVSLIPLLDNIGIVFLIICGILLFLTNIGTRNAPFAYSYLEQVFSERYEEEVRKNKNEKTNNKE